MAFYDTRASGAIAVKLKDGTEVLGTPETGVTDVNYGDGRRFTTVLTLDFALPAIAGGAALAVGKKLLTFPNKPIWVDSAFINVAIQGVAAIQSDTPDLGLGTTIASGAVSVLGGTAAFENVLTGQTMNDCNGTAEVIGTATNLYIAAGASNAVFLNVADTWAAGGDPSADVTGTVVLNWTVLG